MSESIDNTEIESIASEFLKLTNDFAAFSADCAFLCEAFTAIAGEQEDLNEFTSYGIRRYSNSLKEQVIAFDGKIHQLQTRMREQLT
ncbi:hypothetical protein SG34_019835 [Thalassomonas viridans]|uniref:Uncharacterized protein n=1 Tax=Thalassomonas viridans TaxID=137584 RepID=A0AAE9YZ53_9GAMM|nr:hypothetical protein [Thalassomonas viridans]WDE03618.1 hypothetical protein SG34_019835 [Thalassomonas viridans]